VDWPELLEEMEHRLVAARRTLVEGAAPAPRFSESTTTEPLPDTLRERATKILEATKRLESEVRAARDRLSQARRRPLDRATVPSAFVDKRA